MNKFFALMFVGLCACGGSSTESYMMVTTYEDSLPVDEDLFDVEIYSETPEWFLFVTSRDATEWQIANFYDTSDDNDLAVTHRGEPQDCRLVSFIDRLRYMEGRVVCVDDMNLIAYDITFHISN